MAELRDANSNPWYVLMTLYGEQEGEWVDEELHAQNRAVWNAWSCQGLDDDVAAEVAKLARVDVAETRGWAEMAAKAKRRHRAEMTKRNKESDFIYPGFLEATAEVKLWNLNFQRVVDLSSFIFLKDAVFINSNFKKETSFKNAVFVEEGVFESCKFKGPLIFFNSHFLKGANFWDAEFSTGFTFIHSRVMGDARFYDAVFTREATFIRSTFNGYVTFQGAKFGLDDGEHLPDWDEVDPISGQSYRQVDFSDCVFERPTSFRDAHFSAAYPILEGTILHANTDFSSAKENWPQRPKADPAQARESCAKIRHALAKQGLPDEEHFFFRRKMGFAAQIGGFWQRLPYRLFGLVSNFGESIARPLIGLGVAFVTFAVMFSAYFNWMNEFYAGAYRGGPAFSTSLQPC